MKSATAPLWMSEDKRFDNSQEPELRRKMHMVASCSFRIHAGDFLEGSDGIIMFGQLILPTKQGLIFKKEERVPESELEEVEIATEQSVKRLSGTVGWGLAGGVLLGPAGLLAGLLLGGRDKEVTFVARLHDGRKFLGTTDNGTYIKLKAATLKNTQREEKEMGNEDQSLLKAFRDFVAK